MKKIYIQPEVEVIAYKEPLMDGYGGSVHDTDGGETTSLIGNGGEGSDDDEVDAKWAYFDSWNTWED